AGKRRRARQRLGSRSRLAGNLGRPVGEVVGDLERDRDVLDPADLGDRTGALAGPTAGLPAEVRLQRLALRVVCAFVDEDPHRRLRALPDVPVEVAQRNDVQAVEAHVAVVSLANVPGENAVAVTFAWSLGKRAGAGNGALADVEPVSDQAPLWDLGHRSSFPKSCVLSAAILLRRRGSIKRRPS